MQVATLLLPPVTQLSTLNTQLIFSRRSRRSHEMAASKGVLAAGLRGEINDDDDVNDDEKQGLRITNALLYT